LVATSVRYKKGLYVKVEISYILIHVKKYVAVGLILEPNSVMMETLRMGMGVQAYARLKMDINAMILYAVKYVEMERQSKDVMMAILKMVMVVIVNAKLK
jgi:hypothetical protein